MNHEPFQQSDAVAGDEPELAVPPPTLPASDDQPRVSLSGIPLNPEQWSAVDRMLEFVSPDNPASSRFFLLVGPAGTGKTTTTKELALQAKGCRIAFTAPTNKAVRVLRESLVGVPNAQCATIYSLLGLKLEANGMIKEITIPQDVTIEDFDAVVVDEGSMVNSELFGIIREAQRVNDIPFIFMGDPAQLPPVKEKSSPIWKIEDFAQLTKVMRHDNQILKLATHLRSKVDLPFPRLDIQSDNAAEEGVWLMPEVSFEGGILKHAAAGDFHKGTTKAIAWRNVTVNKLNQLIRQHTLGDTPLPFAKGDRVIARQPCYDGKDLLLHTDDEGEVLEVAEAKNRWFSQFDTIRLKVKPDSKTYPLWLWTVHPSTADALNKKLKLLVEEAGKDRRKWRDFWALKEAFHDIALAYAITAHRSQGSTYTTTFVDMKDILANPEKSEALRCLYVACTRSKKQLFLKG